MAGRVGKSPQTGRGSCVNLRPLRWAEGIRCLQLGPRSLLQLLARRSDEFGCCSYRQEVLARELGCSKRSVSNYLRILRHFGLVRLIGRQSGFQRISSVYHLVGWGERKAIPISGHPVFGRYVKEPGGRDRLEIERAQILLRDAERIAAHNKDSELNTTSAEEDILELCIRALGNWPGSVVLWTGVRHADDPSSVSIFHEGMGCRRSFGSFRARFPCGGAEAREIASSREFFWVRSWVRGFAPGFAGRFALWRGQMGRESGSTPAAG